MTYLKLIAHLFLLLFWTRLWVKSKQAFYFNPFLSGGARLTNAIVGFLRPALRLPDRPAALALLLFFWVFQALFFVKFGKPAKVSFGLVSFAPDGDPVAWGMQFAYSGLWSAQFLLHVWSLYFFARLIASANRATRAQEAFTFFTSPFSRLPLLVQPVVLLALHAALVVTVIRTGATPFAVEDILRGDAVAVPELFTSGPALTRLVKIGWLAVMSFTNGIQALFLTLMFFLMSGIIMMLSGAKLPTAICRESADVLMGRFARKSTPGGGLDFSPVLFVLGVSLLSGHLQATLCKLILMPLPPP